MATAQPTSDTLRRWCRATFWVIVWVWSTYGFLADDVITPLADYRSMVMWGLDAVMVAMALMVVRDRVHLLIIGTFVALSWVCTCITGHESTLFWLNGMRDFIGFLLAYPVLLFIAEDKDSRTHFLDQLDRQGLYLLMVHGFCIIVQTLIHGAGDMVGGGYGHYFSGQVSITIYLLSFYLLRRRLDPENFMTSLMRNKVYLVLLMPTFLNETKVSFVMMALYFLFLIPIDRKILTRIMTVGPLLALALWLGLETYDYSTSRNQSGFKFESVDDVLSYFVIPDVEEAEGGARWDMENNRGVTDVPRFTKIAYLAILNDREPGHLLTGYGVGQFKGGTQIAISDFARTYDWLLMGSVPYLFHIYIQLGLVGGLMLQVYWVVLGRRKPRWAVGRDINLQLMQLCTVLILYIYMDMFRNLVFCLMFFALFMASWIPCEPNDNSSP